MAEVPFPVIKLTYNNRDITRAVENDLVMVRYLDRTDVESDELEVTMEDSTGKWTNDWYPEHGAKLTLDIGYMDNLVPCGDFEIDEIPFSGGSGGRKISMRALSAIVTQPFRTKNTFAYENITLERLARTVASRVKLVVSGNIENITFARVSQRDETDLAFLARVAADYGYVFNVKSGKLVFTKLKDLQARTPVATITYEQMKDINLVDATGRSYGVAKQRYYDASKGRSITFDQQIGEGSDTFLDESPVENKQQAELRAQAARLKILNNQIRGSITLHTGIPTLVAGNNINLVGVGAKLDGRYSIEASTHTITRQEGYSTSIEIVRSQ